MPRNVGARGWKEAAPVFAALGDETRLLVVSRLCEEGPQSIAKLTHGSNVTRQAVTKHLQVLAQVGLVSSTREGRETVYQMRPKRLSKAQQLLGLISQEWDETVNRLKAFVEEDDR